MLVQLTLRKQVPVTMIDVMIWVVHDDDVVTMSREVMM